MLQLCARPRQFWLSLYSQGDEEGDEPAELPEGTEGYEEDGDEVRLQPCYCQKVAACIVYSGAARVA